MGPERVRAEWRRVGPHGYVYEDRDLRVFFRFESPDKVHWRFDNRLQLRMRVLDLTLLHDETAFTPWGELVSEAGAVTASNLSADPLGFIAYEYPVRVRNAFGFRELGSGEPRAVRFTADWSGFAGSYHLTFPTQEEP